MQIAGGLDRTTLGDVLGALHRERVTGSLELIEPGGIKHDIYLEQGCVGNVRTAGAPRLGELLRRRGVVRKEHAQQFERICFQAWERLLGEALVEASLVTPPDLRAVLHAQLLDRLELVYQLRVAAIRFRVSQKKNEQTVVLAADEFLHGRPRLRERRCSPTRSECASRAAALRTLALPLCATEGDIRRAFRQLAGPIHPDRLTQLEPSERHARLGEFKRFSAAYQKLVSPAA